MRDKGLYLAKVACWSHDDSFGLTLLLSSSLGDMVKGFVVILLRSSEELVYD